MLITDSWKTGNAFHLENQMAASSRGFDRLAWKQRSYQIEISSGH